MTTKQKQKHIQSEQDLELAVTLAKRQQFVIEPDGTTNDRGAWLPSEAEWHPCCGRLLDHFNAAMQEHVTTDEHLGHAHGLAARDVKALSAALWRLITVVDYDDHQHLAAQIDYAAAVLHGCGFDIATARTYVDAGVAAEEVPHWEALRSRGVDVAAAITATRPESASGPSALHIAV